MSLIKGRRTKWSRLCRSRWEGWSLFWESVTVCPCGEIKRRGNLVAMQHVGAGIRQDPLVRRALAWSSGEGELLLAGFVYLGKQLSRSRCLRFPIRAMEKAAGHVCIRIGGCIAHMFWCQGLDNSTKLDWARELFEKGNAKDFAKPSFTLSKIWVAEIGGRTLDLVLWRVSSLKRCHSSTAKWWKLQKA